MFTGIVTDLGRVGQLQRGPELRARIHCGYDMRTMDVGAALACDGVSLSVVAIGADWFEVTVSGETLARTNLGHWAEGRRINLERALRVGDELGGHIVSGHVDGQAEVLSAEAEGGSTRYVFRAPAVMTRFLASKGSVALNGTSLTVNEVSDDTFGVNMTPHTRSATNWDDVAAGDMVNLEIDTLARYVARLREVDG